MGVRRLEYSWDWSTGLEWLARKDPQEGWKAGPLLMGLWLTLKVSAVAILAALPIGVVTGLARVSPDRGLRTWATLYVELVRNSPLLVQVFIAYWFVGKLLDTAFTDPTGTRNATWESHRAFLMGGLAMAVFAGAYVGEIVRGGIESVERGQMEAARALGLSRLAAMRHVILPQALRRSLPAMAGQFISLVKDSSLLSVIGVTEVLMSARQMMSATFLSLEPWFLAAALYLSITFPLSFGVQFLERRLARAD